MIAQALKDYYQEHIQHTASKKNAPGYEKKLKDFFGAQFVSDITQSRINQFVREWQAKGVSNGTIRRDLEHLQGALNHAEREQRLLYVPKWRKPPPPQPRERRLTKDEINLLLENCESDHTKDFIVLMLETKQRPGAIENLTWFQVDFKAGIIHFDRTGKQQTNKRVRPVAMSDTAYALLKRLHKIKQTEYVLEYTPINTVKPIPARCVRKSFERACQRAELKGVSRYTLRHTAIDELDDLNADDKTMSDIAGHTNTKTTRLHYIKTKIEKQRVILNKASKQRKFSAKAKMRKK
jgi:integrase